jgi:hypothetical protein
MAIWIYNFRWLPKNTDGMVLWPFVLVRHKKSKTTKKLIRHETKHVEQVYKYWILGFYVVYLYQYLKNRIKGMNHQKAYWNNPFEIEARKAELNLGE